MLPLVTLLVDCRFATWRSAVIWSAAACVFFVHEWCVVFAMGAQQGELMFTDNLLFVPACASELL